MAKKEIVQERWMIYAALIQDSIGQMFQPENENYINPDDFLDDEKLKDFIHALANVAPTSIWNKLTGEEKNLLQFNHVSNQLCFEYMTQKDDSAT